MSLPFLPAAGECVHLKSFKVRSTLDQLTNYEVKKHCGMDIIHARELLELLGPALEPMTSRSHAVRPETQLISAISFFRSSTSKAQLVECHNQP